MDGLFFSAARNSSYFLSRARFQREKLCDMHFEHDVAYLRHVHRATRFRYQRRFLLSLVFILFLIFISLIFFFFFSSSSFHFFFHFIYYFFLFLGVSFTPSFSLLLLFPFSYLFHCFDIFPFLFLASLLEKKLLVFSPHFFFLFPLFFFSFVTPVFFFFRSFSFFLSLSFDVSSLDKGTPLFRGPLGLPLIRHVF